MVTYVFAILILWGEPKLFIVKFDSSERIRKIAMKYNKFSSPRFSTSVAGLLLGSITLTATSIAPGLANGILTNKSAPLYKNMGDVEFTAGQCTPCPFNPYVPSCICFSQDGLKL